MTSEMKQASSVRRFAWIFWALVSFGVMVGAEWLMVAINEEETTWVIAAFYFLTPIVAIVFLLKKKFHLAIGLGIGYVLYLLYLTSQIRVD